MGEIEKRTDEQQEEVEDSVLALSESGWSQREIAAELSISRKSIQPYRERALARVPIPDHEEAVRENIVQLRWVMDACKSRLRSANLPETSINVGNLLREYRMARAELNDVLEKYRRKDETFGGLTLFASFQNPDVQADMSMTTEEWAEVTDTELNDDGVYEPVEP